MGSFSDMWRINISWINQLALQNEQERDDDGWRQVQMKGTIPEGIYHHKVLVQEDSGVAIFYGGIQNQEANDTIYVLNLDSLTWKHFPIKQ